MESISESNRALNQAWLKTGEIKIRNVNDSKQKINRKMPQRRNERQTADVPRKKRKV